MKVISIWQPYASLIVHGFKINETRSWAAPVALIGQTIAIAATKQIKPEQRAIVTDPTFAHFYDRTKLPVLDELPMGAIVGTVQLNSCDLIDEEVLDDITEEEEIFGWYEVGRYAWRLRDPRPLTEPVFTRGYQGIWDHDFDETGTVASRAATPLRVPVRDV